MRSKYGVRVAGWPGPIARRLALRAASGCEGVIALVHALLFAVCWTRCKAAKRDGPQCVESQANKARYLSGLQAFKSQPLEVNLRVASADAVCQDPCAATRQGPAAGAVS